MHHSERGAHCRGDITLLAIATRLSRFARQGTDKQIRQPCTLTLPRKSNLVNPFLILHSFFSSADGEAVPETKRTLGLLNCLSIENKQVSVSLAFSHDFQTFGGL